MSMPSMDSSNLVARLTQRIAALETKLQQLTSASGTLDAATIYKGGLTIVDPDTGQRIVLSEGDLRFWDDYAGNPNGYGGIVSNGPSYINLRPPYTTGSPLDTEISLIGKSPSVGGIISVKAVRSLGGPGAGVSVTSNTVTISGTDSLSLDGGGTLVFSSLPTTGSAANLRKDPSTDTVYAVVSSRRYKEDIADAVVDSAEVLQLQPRSWVDKGTAERMAEAGDEGDIPRNVGFIAEELDALPSMRQFVDYIDLDGELVPDAIQYDRLSVGLIELAKTQQTQIDAQANAIADLTTRLEALEAK